MSIRQLAENTSKEILDALGGDSARAEDVARIVEKALLDVMRDTRTECATVVHDCCSADQDLAHKISEEMRQKENALIANLSSLR